MLVFVGKRDFGFCYKVLELKFIDIEPIYGFDLLPFTGKKKGKENEK